MEASAVRAKAQEAEAVRRRLREEGRLRMDLRVARDGDDVVFPVTQGDDRFDFTPLPSRARDYTDLLDAPTDLVAQAPRAFDTLGEIVIVKVPPAWAGREAEIGSALRAFTGARAVFHDAGVTGEFRTRSLQRISGAGESATTVQEHGLRLHVDPARAYFSPRLADERARVAAMTGPGKRLVDLFGGVGALAVLAARAGAEVDCVDLNPAATEMARRNAEVNRVDVQLHTGDARLVAKDLKAAEQVVMNLPHGAWDFLDVAAPLVRPGGVLHYHEILENEALGDREEALSRRLIELGWDHAVVEHVRHVRAYSATQSHVCMDVRR